MPAEVLLPQDWIRHLHHHEAAMEDYNLETSRPLIIVKFAPSIDTFNIYT